MLGGKSRPPMIGLLTGSLISGNRSGAADLAVSTPRSPKTPKNFDLGGVGLGIVAALEKSGETPAVFSRNLSRSSPIPVNSPKSGKACPEETDSDSESFEEYTIVTFREQDRSYTTVYRGCDQSPYRMRNSQKSSVFHISPARLGDTAGGSPASDFLSACHLCQKKLQGEDIYMYRGEKAFCSAECRYRQIVTDERTENCSSEASRAVDLSSSPYANGQIFTAGILAI